MTHTIRRTLAAAAALALAGCADAPSAPTAAASLEIVNPAVTATVLERTTPLPRDITRSITLNKTGGAIQIPEAGFQLNIPRNAIGNGPITITVTALAGKQVAYRFGPHGTRFLSPINMTQALDGTTLAGNIGTAKLEGGYFLDGDLDPATGTALVQEFLPVTVVTTGNRLHMDIRHFSGYVIATGRTR